MPARGSPRHVVLSLQFMLRNWAIKTHWVQPAWDIESLFQCREIQVGLERIVALPGARFSHFRLDEGPARDCKVMGQSGWRAGR